MYFRFDSSRSRKTREAFHAGRSQVPVVGALRMSMIEEEWWRKGQQTLQKGRLAEAHVYSHAPHKGNGGYE